MCGIFIQTLDFCFFLENEKTWKCWDCVPVGNNGLELSQSCPFDWDLLFQVTGVYWPAWLLSLYLGLHGHWSLLPSPCLHGPCCAASASFPLLLCSFSPGPGLPPCSSILLTLALIFSPFFAGLFYLGCGTLFPILIHLLMLPYKCTEIVILLQRLLLPLGLLLPLSTNYCGQFWILMSARLEPKTAGNFRLSLSDHECLSLEGAPGKNTLSLEFPISSITAISTSHEPVLLKSLYFVYLDPIRSLTLNTS